MTEPTSTPPPVSDPQDEPAVPDAGHPLPDAPPHVDYVGTPLGKLPEELGGTLAMVGNREAEGGIPAEAEPFDPRPDEVPQDPARQPAAAPTEPSATEPPAAAADEVPAVAPAPAGEPVEAVEPAEPQVF